MSNKTQLVEDVASRLEVTKKTASDAVDAIFGHISKQLADGERVQIPGFGTFVVTARKERQGRNPQTGATMTIKASNSVRFKPGKGLKDAVN
ncbi:MAG: HU family DNA-binding protein [bacterium]|nr:HU family DNA-binding protein [bacterium]